MAIRPVVIAVLCVGLFSIFESLMMPKALALRTNDRMDDQKSQRPRNYMLPRARNEEIPEELAFIVDYANTLDDEYFLDKSIETKKTGNIELKKRYQDQSLPDMQSSCECKYIEVPEPLGYNIFPSSVVSRICSNTPELRSCPYPYRCEEIMYPMAVLRMKSKRDKDAPPDFDSIDLLPPRLRGLSIGWNPDFKNVSVGCQCSNKYVFHHQ